MTLIRKAAAVGAALALVTLGTAASAQGPMGPGGPNNPLQANPMALLQRPEVQTELRLDVKQKAAIADLQAGSAQEMGSRIRQAMQGVDFRAMRNVPREEMQQRMEATRTQVEAAMQSWQGELNDKIKAILRPEQMTRLHQLDLQRRGPLALGDVKVQEELKVAPERRAAIQKAVSDYQQRDRQLMQEALQQMVRSGPRSPASARDSRTSPARCRRGSRSAITSSGPARPPCSRRSRTTSVTPGRLRWARRSRSARTRRRPDGETEWMGE